MLGGVAVGLLLIIGGILLRPHPSPDEIRTVGKIVNFWDGYALGEPATSYAVEFHDNTGQSRQFQPRMTGALGRSSVGAEVMVAYSPSQPQSTARRVDGIDGHLHKILVGVGTVAAVSFSLAAVL